MKVEVSEEVRKYKSACDLSANCCAEEGDVDENEDKAMCFMW